MDVPDKDWPATQAACASLGSTPHYFDAPSAVVAGRAIALWEQALAGVDKPRAYRLTCNTGRPCDPRAAIRRLEGAQVMKIDWTMPVLSADRLSYRLVLRKEDLSLIVTVFPRPNLRPPSLVEVPETLEAVHIGV